MILFEEKKDCSSCGACANICPKSAISMKEDEYGFLYPYIDKEKCVECGACTKVCDFRKPLTSSGVEKKCFFAVRKDSKELMHSTSGGLGSVIAESFLKQNGVVFGCVAERTDAGFKVYHKAVKDFKELNQIRGSKYVQSNAQVCFPEVKEYLQKGVKVLFSGTPCQVAGLKSYLRKDYDNLYTIDLICHGTPSVKLLNAFLHFMEKKYHNTIQNFNFRKKYKNRDTNTFFYFDMEMRNAKHKKMFCKLASYYGYFLSGDIYRESCYQCKYACPERVGDITLGDGWGLDKLPPEYIDVNGGAINIMYGSNSVILNTDKAREIFEQIQNDVTFYQATFEEVSKHNHQLLEPTPKKPLREELLQMFVTEGYEAIDKKYFDKMSKKEYIKFKFYFPLKQAIPKSLIKVMKSVKG